MEFLNSPFSVLIVFAVVAAIIFYRKRSGLDRGCGVCGVGVMEETGTKSEQLVAGTSIDATSTASVLYTIKYRCSNCDNTLVRTENRR